MSNFPKYVRAAIDACREKEYDEHVEYHLAAVIVTGGRIVSIGINGPKTNSFIEAFKVTSWSNMHAECDAILRARRKVDLRGSKMYVARVTKQAGTVANSRPCEMCIEACRLYGIKRICYTLDENTYAVMRV